RTRELCVPALRDSYCAWRQLSRMSEPRIDNLMLNWSRKPKSDRLKVARSQPAALAIAASERYRSLLCPSNKAREAARAPPASKLPLPQIQPRSRAIALEAAASGIKPLSLSPSESISCQAKSQIGISSPLSESKPLW